MRKRYWLAEDCPQCGEKDSEDAWKGARMGDSRWGHNFTCCSNACGMAYRDNPARIEREKAAIREQINALQSQLSRMR